MIRRDDIALLATLNDLLQLEYDALPSYSLAIAALQSSERRQTLQAFREDHCRHVRELTALIRQRGGFPLALPHLPTGMLKLMVQLAGIPGGDRAILLAFRANDWQSRTKYAHQASGDYEAEVAAILRQAAEDEARHYAWASGVLDEMGVGSGTVVGMANGLFARVHGMTAEGIEAAGRIGLEALARIARPR